MTEKKITITLRRENEDDFDINTSCEPGINPLECAMCAINFVQMALKDLPPIVSHAFAAMLRSQIDRVINKAINGDPSDLVVPTPENTP